MCIHAYMHLNLSSRNDLVSILLYADDIVLIAESAADLQVLLDCLNEWCGSNNMTLNATKSNIVHFRPNSAQKTTWNFMCGENSLLVTERYTYLGIALTEFQDFNITAKVVAQSAGRALGLLIAKFKCMGGMPYDVFTRLYDTMVWPVISYGASVWGVKSFTCINAVQNRAMRFFLGTGKYTPNAAVSGDMGWQPVQIKLWKSISIHWHRMVHMNDNRVNKRIFLWSDTKSGRGCKNHTFHVKENLRKFGLGRYADVRGSFSKKALISDTEEAMMLDFIAEWSLTVRRESGRTRNGRNKLRTYRLFKSEYKTEAYCKLLLPLSHRSAFAKFRCGVAPIRIETGRYENIDLEHRLCHFCNVIEDEMHVILDCSHYNDLRTTLISKATSILSNFNDLSHAEKMQFLFSNINVIRLCAKTCFKILQKRNAAFYK